MFISKLQRILPNLKRLNGRNLSQKITFAVERESNSKPDHPSRKPLPQSIQGYFPSEDVRLPVLSFLKTFFFRYDTRPRGENLLPYYTSASQFVYSVATEFKMGQINPSTARVEISGPNGELSKLYYTTARLSSLNLLKSRNLLRCQDENRRRDCVLRGSLAIAAFLDEYPATEHVLESLCVDVVFHSPTQLLLTVSGVFYELYPLKSSSSTSSPGPSNNHQSNVGSMTRKILRCFSRTMILVAPGDHIMQDDLIISNPTPSVCKKYITDAASRLQQNQPTQQQPPQQQQSEQVQSPSSQDLILTEFRQRTGMNLNFARQCLQEYNWDVNAAWVAFETMQAAGKIPAAAFT